MLWLPERAGVVSSDALYPLVSRYLLHSEPKQIGRSSEDGVQCWQRRRSEASAGMQDAGRVVNEHINARQWIWSTLQQLLGIADEIQPEGHVNLVHAKCVPAATCDLVQQAAAVRGYAMTHSAIGSTPHHTPELIRSYITSRLRMLLNTAEHWAARRGNHLACKLACDVPSSPCYRNNHCVFTCWKVQPDVLCQSCCQVKSYSRRVHASKLAPYMAAGRKRLAASLLWLTHEITAHYHCLYRPWHGSSWLQRLLAATSTRPCSCTYRAWHGSTQSVMPEAALACEACACRLGCILPALGPN